MRRTARLKAENLERVRAFVKYRVDPFTVMDIARALRLRIGEVQHIFHLLNLKGLLSRPYKRVDRPGCRRDCCSGDRYYVLGKGQPLMWPWRILGPKK